VRPRGVVVATLLAVLLLTALYPIRQYLAQAANVRRLAAEHRDLEERIARLRELRDRLRTDAEVERIAREELGMVRPGEVPFVVVSPPTDAPPGTAGSPPETPREPGRAGREPPWLERWWRVFRGALRSL
jgi:cell division protein FtsB